MSYSKTKKPATARNNAVIYARYSSSNFNARVKSDDGLKLLKHEQAQNEKDLQNTLTAIRMGDITKATKEMLEQLEEKKERLAVEIAKLSSRKPKILGTNDCADFLFSLTALDFSVAENRKLLFDRFVRRVELGNRKIRIFFNPADRPYLYSEKEDDLTPMEKEESPVHAKIGVSCTNAGNETSPDNSPVIGCSSGDALGGTGATHFEPFYLPNGRFGMAFSL
jgi:hypothetical protein